MVSKSRATSRSPLRDQYAKLHGPQSKSIGAFVGGFKSKTTKKINQLRLMYGISIWQRNYYEHIIRDEKSYHKLSDYIINNPMSWQEDKYYEL